MLCSTTCHEPHAAGDRATEMLAAEPTLTAEELRDHLRLEAGMGEPPLTHR